MLKPRVGQGSFFDTDLMCEHLVPPDSFYRNFRELVSPLIKDEMFESMYCNENGRPPIPPALLAMATILQFHKNLSDREMERACLFDIEIKYALGLRLDERPFDHSSLGDFRKRLLENGKEKEIFENILNHLVKAGLIKKHETQRIDATHVIADVAIPTMVTLVKKGIYGVLKPLGKRHKNLLEKVLNEIDADEYSKAEVNHDATGRLDMENRKKKLVDVVADARRVLGRAGRIKNDRILERRVDTLRRILRENIEDEKGGTPKEMSYKEKPKDLLVTPVDPDARYGAKTRTRRFTGYKANITESVESRFITSIMAMPGNRPDGVTTVDAVLGQKKNGLAPKKLIGDAAYSNGAYRKELKKYGTELVAPLRTRNAKTRALYPKSMFHYNEKKETLTCPAGVTTKRSYYDYQNNIIMFHFPMSECTRCRRRKRCTSSSDGRRTVGISEVHRELIEAERYNRTRRFKKDMAQRQPVEGKISELKRWHGLTRARYRGLGKVGLQCYFTAAAVNIKRWIKIMLEQTKPKLRVAPV